jgi:O-6-methylguanine DNA methyltransferase
MNESNDNESIILYHGIMETPLGNMVGCATERGIVMLLFENEANKSLAIINLNKKGTLCDSKNDLLLQLELQLKAYFNGSSTKFNIPLDLQGTLFQKKVWEIVQQIPHGTTRTYKDIALEMGNINGVRAVASANAENNILLLIPCHRIIGTGNKLTGYRGGIEKKRWLLDFERTTGNKKPIDQLF